MALQPSLLNTVWPITLVCALSASELCQGTQTYYVCLRALLSGAEVDTDQNFRTVESCEPESES